MESIDRIIKPYLLVENLMKPYVLMEKFMKPNTQAIKVSEAYLSLQKEVEASVKAFSQSMKQISMLTEIGKGFSTPIFEQFERISGFSAKINEVYLKVPETLLTLAEYGWYLDFESDFIMANQLSKIIKEGKIDEANDHLIEYYQDRLESIFNELSKRHVKRKKILEQIYLSYNQKLYYVAIPCLLAQVDGVSNDFTNKKFFLKDRKNNYLPEVAIKITELAEMLTMSFLSPILNHTPIMAHSSELDSFPVNLNRHTVLHGTDIEYGTEMNCLKCISLLKYMSDILNELE